MNSVERTVNPGFPGTTTTDAPPRISGSKLAFIGFVLHHNLMHSKVGRAMRAVAQNREPALGHEIELPGDDFVSKLLLGLEVVIDPQDKGRRLHKICVQIQCGDQPLERLFQGGHVKRKLVSLAVGSAPVAIL